MPKEITMRLTRQFVLDEKPLVICFNSHRQIYYVVTSRRVISVVVASKYSMLTISSVLMIDIVRIDEGLTNNLVGYNIYTADQHHIGISIEEANELAFNFGSILYQVYNQSKQMG